MDVAGALYDKMAGDATLVALLSTYNGVPAVFTSKHPPPDVTLPYIHTFGNISDVPFDTKTDTGRDVARDIHCFAEATGDESVVEAIADRVRELFHREPVPMTGGTVYIASCSGPVPAETDDSITGRIVSVRFRIQT